MALTPVAVADRTGAAQNMDMLQDPSGNNIPLISLDSTRATYRAAQASVAVITTTTKTLVTVTGSATKTVRIHQFSFSLSAATAAQCVVQLQRVSAIGTGGTLSTPTVAKLDTNSAAATAVVSSYITGAQSQGTAVGGLIAVQQVSETVTTTAPTFLGGFPVQWMFPENGVKSGQAIVLRGTADILEFQNATAIGTTPALSYAVEWSEDGS